MSFAIRRLSAMTARRRKAFYGLAALLAILLMGAQGVYNAFSESAEPAATYIIDRGDIEKPCWPPGSSNRLSSQCRGTGQRSVKNCTSASVNG